MSINSNLIYLLVLPAGIQYSPDPVLRLFSQSLGHMFPRSEAPLQTGPSSLSDPALLQLGVGGMVSGAEG